MRGLSIRQESLEPHWAPRTEQGLPHGLCYPEEEAEEEAKEAVSSRTVEACTSSSLTSSRCHCRPSGWSIKSLVRLGTGGSILKPKWADKQGALWQSLESNIVLSYSQHWAGIRGPRTCYCLAKLSFHLGFLVGSDGKESACNAGDLCLIAGWGRCPEEGNGYPLQYSCLENPWTEEPGGLQSMGSQSQRQRKRLSTHAQAHIASWFFQHFLTPG